MNRAKNFYILSLFSILLLMIGKPVFGQDMSGKNIWDYNVNLRFWGADVCANYNGFTWINGEDTRLWLSLGGGYEDSGFYRTPDGNVYNPPKHGDDLGVFKRSNILSTFGLRQGLFHIGDGRFEAVAMLRHSEDKNLSSQSPEGSLVFLSSFPDRRNLTENSILIGLNYDYAVQDGRQRTIKGFKMEVSYELSPDDWNKIADYSRTNLCLEALVPVHVHTNDTTSVYFVDRLFYDRLDGDYIPISARNSLGGIGYFPGIHSNGLGGYIRGLPMGYEDGKIKAGNNLDFRVDFSSLWGWEKVKPGLVGFYDVGVSSERNADFEKVYKTIGVGVSMHIDWPLKGLNLGIYDAYSFDEECNRAFIGFDLPF